MLGCVEDGGGVSGNNTAKPVTQECMCFYICKCETAGDTWQCANILKYEHPTLTAP